MIDWDMGKKKRHSQCDRQTNITWDLTYIAWAEYSEHVAPMWDMGKKKRHSQCDRLYTHHMIGKQTSHGISHTSHGLSTQSMSLPCDIHKPIDLSFVRIYSAHQGSCHARVVSIWIYTHVYTCITYFTKHLHHIVYTHLYMCINMLYILVSRDKDTRRWHVRGVRVLALGPSLLRVWRGAVIMYIYIYLRIWM